MFRSVSHFWIRPRCLASYPVTRLPTPLYSLSRNAAIVSCRFLTCSESSLPVLALGPMPRGLGGCSSWVPLTAVMGLLLLFGIALLSPFPVPTREPIGLVHGDMRGIRERPR